MDSHHEIMIDIESLGRLKAQYDCVVKGKNLYGEPVNEENRSSLLASYGKHIENRTDALEAQCSKIGFDFNLAMLRVNIASEEVIRRARTPDASDGLGPVFR